MAPVNNAHFTPARTPGGGGGGTPTGGGTSGYFVEASDVANGQNSLSGTYITLSIDGVSAYQEGMVVRFRNTVRNQGRVYIRIEGLNFQEVLTLRGERFPRYEFRFNAYHTIFYNGSNWVATDAVNTPVTIIDPSDFSFDASSNEITVRNPEQIFYYEGIAQILFRMEGTNTGDVTLNSVPVLTSRGEQIREGYLSDGMDVRDWGARRVREVK